MTVAELMDDLTHLLSDHEQKRKDWQQLVSELGQAKTRIAELEAELHRVSLERDLLERTVQATECDTGRDLAAARARVAALEAIQEFGIPPSIWEAGKIVAASRARIAALEAERDAIDLELYGETPLGYNPNRAVTIRAIKELSPAINGLTSSLATARARIAALEAERDRLRGALEYVLVNGLTASRKKIRAALGRATIPR